MSRDQWKETLFVWRGDLYRMSRSRQGAKEEEEERVVWRGSWVGTEDAAQAFPSDDDFESSLNTFELSGAASGCDLVHTTAPDLTSEENKNTTPHIEWTEGHYLLDNGDGLENYEDFEHHCCFKGITLLVSDTNMVENDVAESSASTQGKGWYVVARGKTEYGDFFSKGLVEPSCRKTSPCIEIDEASDLDTLHPLGLTLTLARRYLPNSDNRKHLLLEEHLNIMAVEDLSGDIVVKPWENLPTKVKRKQSTQHKSKKQKV